MMNDEIRQIAIEDLTANNFSMELVEIVDISSMEIMRQTLAIAKQSFIEAIKQHLKNLHN